jgi:hypothetical protein
MASGGMLEQRLAPAPGQPVIRRWATITLDYRHMGSLAGELDARLAFPGPHELTVWKHVTLGYLADGVLSDWNLPWRLAPHVLSPPAGAPLERFASSIRLGFDSPPLAVMDHDSVTYDAGMPGPGQAWLERGGRRFKTAAAPAAGMRIIVEVVPLYSVVVVGEDHSRRYQDAIREPRRISLTESVI